MIAGLVLNPFLPPNNGYLSFQYQIIESTYHARKYFSAYTPVIEDFETNSTESIFMLQLESTNAIVLEGQMPKINEKKYDDLYAPYFYQAAKDGVLFPYFWSNSVTTDRAQENILCGLVNNIGAPLSYHPEKLTAKCLPNILNNNGYKTIIFRSDDLSFHNMGNFFQAMGFSEIHNKDIMKPDDKKYIWGYDDCIFYQRAFEYLKENYPDGKKLFVYFEVSSHHIPWTPFDSYTFTHKFVTPSNYAETYINSSLQQDYCFSRFYKEYQDYNNGKSHLFAFGDHSWPVGINNGNTLPHYGSYNENFLTMMAYIPPKNDLTTFFIDKIVSKNNIYSETDIIPTIFELLNNNTYQNSLVFELQKNKQKENYENCHILVQPYDGGQIVVVNGLEKYIYYVSKKLVLKFDLKDDFWEKNPEIADIDISNKEFKEKYFCQRFK